MAKIKVTDQWLYETIPLIDEANLRVLEKHVDDEYEFSPDFERKMESLLEGKYQKSERKYNPRWMKQAAAGAAVVLSLAFATATSVYAYKIYSGSTIKTAQEDSVLYTYLFPDHEKADEQFEKIKPYVVPEGYRQTEEIEGTLLYSITYEDEVGNQIIWDQQLVEDSLSIVFDSEYQWTQELPINDNTLEIFGYHGGQTISFYENRGYLFMITADDINIEQIENMIKK